MNHELQKREKEMRCAQSHLRYRARSLTFIGVLGCTGSVGQRFILLLANHPTLHLHAVGASARSAGKLYRDAAKWKQITPMSIELGNLQVRECKATNFQDCDLVFSGLDSDVAGEIGKIFPLKFGRYVNLGQ